jgi:hypothetical protein
MATLPSGRYQLKTLHEEIGLFDRKLAHLEKYENFSTEAERVAAAGKLAAKRNLLIRKAQQMIDEGIEFNEIERPKSLRPESEAPIPATSAVVEVTVLEVMDGGEVAEPVLVGAPEMIPSPYAGTSLDYQSDLAAYKKRARSKTA